MDWLLSQLAPTSLVFLFFEIVGIAFAIDVLFTGRTPQGTLAWALGLLLLPPLAVPLYAVFGPRRLQGYVRARRRGTLKINKLGKSCTEALAPFALPAEARQPLECSGRTTLLPPTHSNTVRLLINGDATFTAIFDAIDNAKDYVLVQFYIISYDSVGRELERRLQAARKRGVRVYLLYDRIGSGRLTKLEASLSDSGCVMSGSRGPRIRLHINFRNHRKVVVVDGKVAFLGGLNVADAYLGHDKTLKPWRDTHAIIRGPSVLGIQLAFCEDWFWANDTVPELCWVPEPAPTGSSGDAQHALIIPNSPADDFETLSLILMGLIVGARRRVWIATPYFAPPGAILSALQLAALRGIDVRIVTSKLSDNRLVQSATAAYFSELLPAGAKILRHQPGFMHQKVALVDDVAYVGSANLDSRSLRINFEIGALVNDRRFSSEVADMLEADMAGAETVTEKSLAARPWYFKLATRLARLFAPIL